MLVLPLAASFPLPALSQVRADNPAIVSLLARVERNTSALLPQFALAGDQIAKWQDMFKHGPHRRDFCNKMAYAPDRRTALYAGANHGVPHRLNDVWEYHLGSNSWVLLFAPDGGDHRRATIAQGAATGRDRRMTPEDARAFLANWYTEVVTFQHGYLQTRRGGPIEPLHTWDGLTYDPRSRRMIWATLSNDSTEQKRLAAYAEYTGQDVERLKAQQAPGTSLWMYEPHAGKWRRQTGDGPRPKTRGMGGFLLYIPDLGRSVWYTATSYDNSGMWSYDSIANAWTNLKPNDGLSIYGNNQHERPGRPAKDIFPPQEMQAAYSPRHHKIVAVQESGVWIYDVRTNWWTKTLTDERISARDSRTVFVYDSANDVFLLLDPNPGKQTLFAYSLTANRWERLEPGGAGIVAGKGAGYYDPDHNLFVVYLNTNRMWVYRYRKQPDKNGGENR